MKTIFEMVFFDTILMFFAVIVYCIIEQEYRFLLKIICYDAWKEEI